MYAIRKQVPNSSKPEEKGRLIAIYKTYSEASKNCKEGYYVCQYVEPQMPGTNQIKHPFN